MIAQAKVEKLVFPQFSEATVACPRKLKFETILYFFETIPVFIKLDNKKLD